MLDAGDLFPVRDVRDEAQARAVAAVCARLGGPPERRGEGGHLHTIVGGALDGDRVAWVEQRWQDAGYDDIDGYTLFMREGDAGTREWVVDTYNPWFGCEILDMRWMGADLAVIYSEKHHTIACVLGPAGAPRMRVLHHRWQRLGDLVLHASEAHGLVERIRLPDLSRRAPLTVAAAALDLAAGTCEPAPPLSPASTASQRQIAARLPPIAGPTAELLVGALAYRFWDDRPHLSATYEQAYAQSHRWNPPCWLPFYHHRCSGGAAARALLAELDTVAARPPAACAADDAPAELAARHIAARCRELAEACRAGHLPEGTSCHFWAEWSQAAFAAVEPLFPAGMWSAFTALRPRARALLALGTHGR